MELKLHITSKMAAIMLAGGLAIALVFGLALGFGAWGRQPQVQPAIQITRVDPIVPLIAFHGFGNTVEVDLDETAEVRIGDEQIIRLLPFGNIAEWYGG